MDIVAGLKEDQWPYGYDRDDDDQYLPESHPTDGSFECCGKAMQHKRQEGKTPKKSQKKQGVKLTYGQSPPRKSKWRWMQTSAY